VKKSPSLIQIQFIVLLLGTGLMIIKFIAHLLTQSNAILSDALESIINVAAGAFALYSLWLSQKPKDLDHPYGHGKIEFISIGFEGGMIVLAAFYILFEATHSFIKPQAIKQLDIGIYLITFSGLVNFVMGRYLVKIGNENRSQVMIADGKHLTTDTYTSIGLVFGLILVKLTGFAWLDGVIALAMGAIILFTGYGLIRKSIAGLMDEADEEILDELLPVLNLNRKREWIDIHNLRVVKYGSNYHIDAHVTLPYYWSLEKSHEEVSAIAFLVVNKYHQDIELFIHADPCIPSCCAICAISECTVRSSPFIKTIAWTKDNVLKNEKHSIDH
jgi:cation diffusion facilitator family transporter